MSTVPGSPAVAIHLSIPFLVLPLLCRLDLKGKYGIIGTNGAKLRKEAC